MPSIQEVGFVLTVISFTVLACNICIRAYHTFRRFWFYEDTIKQLRGEVTTIQRRTVESLKTMSDLLHGDRPLWDYLSRSDLMNTLKRMTEEQNLHERRYPILLSVVHEMDNLMRLKNELAEQLGLDDGEGRAQAPGRFASMLSVDYRRKKPASASAIEGGMIPENERGARWNLEPLDKDPLDLWNRTRYAFAGITLDKIVAAMCTSQKAIHADVMALKEPSCFEYELQSQLSPHARANSTGSIHGSQTSRNSSDNHERIQPTASSAKVLKSQ